MDTITPFLWFDRDAEKAAKFYVSIFKKGSKIESISRYGAAVGSMPKGSVMTVTFRLAGQKFIALNAGPHYKFTPAISFYVRCKTQKEVDGYWKKLSRGGSDEQCGWLKDKFGLSWQIIPDRLGALLASKDGAKAQRVMQAMLGMKKIEIAGLERAAKG